MTIKELYDELERLIKYEGLDHATQIRTMTQQNWPFEHEIRGLWQPGKAECDGESCEGEDCDLNHDAEWRSQDGTEGAIYLVEGYQVGYGTKNAWDACDTF